jgi:hypothetical protein
MLSSLAELAPALHAHAINTAVPAKVVWVGVIFMREKLSLSVFDCTRNNALRATRRVNRKRDMISFQWERLGVSAFESQFAGPCKASAFARLFIDSHPS